MGNITIKTDHIVMTVDFETAVMHLYNCLIEVRSTRVFSLLKQIWRSSLRINSGRLPPYVERITSQCMKTQYHNGRSGLRIIGIWVKEKIDSR